MAISGKSRRQVLIGGATTIAIGGALAFLPRKRKSASSAPKLVFVPKALNNPVFEITRAGAEDRAREVSVSLAWLGPTTSDAAAQSQIIDDLTVQQVDGICVSCNDPAALMPAINRAVDAGVAVITWDSDAPGSKRLTTIGIAQEKAGARAGELMKERLSSGEVAILTGTPSALNLKMRLDGFVRALSANPQLRIVATDPCNDDIQRAVEIVEQRINATPHLSGYFFAGMWPFFADLKSLTRLREFVSRGGVCISLDALAGALNAVEQGYASALVGYSWYQFGRTAVDVLANYIRAGQRPRDPVYTDLFVVDPLNIAEYQARQHQTAGRF